MKSTKNLSQSTISITSTSSTTSTPDEPARTPKTSFHKKVKLALLLPLKTLSASRMSPSAPKIFRSHSHCRPATQIHRSESSATVHLTDKDARDRENKFRTMPRLGMRRRSSMSDLDRMTSLPDLVSSAQYGHGHSGPSSPVRIKAGTPVTTSHTVLSGGWLCLKSWYYR